MTENSRPIRNRIVLTEISSRAWEHPADRGALVALRKLHGFDTFVRKLSGFLNERMVKMLLLGSCVRVSERQFPRVHRLYAEAAAALDAPGLPELFVQASPRLNAMTIGVDSPKIVIDSALVDLMHDDELRFVLGHELGHALSGHALYRTLLAYMIRFGTNFAGIPIGYWGIRAISAALAEWARKAELSSDRAGLLSTQDVAAAIRVQMKIASGGHLQDLDQTEFLEQAREYEETEDLRDSVMKFMLVEGATHPMNVVRAGELRRWVDSGHYAEILAGSYPRRSEDKDAKISAEAQAAAESYLSAFRSSQDAIARLMRDLGEGVGEFGRWVGGRFRGQG
ncbi:M48 family metallopeptidase [Granulicoccus sp. GXG6511]|uniref:M48 family metallopeptidase n=1 Tax=Granulicoccus sp. GXG6511 TaxID=3381351 RepID=UPI003D7E9C4E